MSDYNYYEAVKNDILNAIPEYLENNTIDLNDYINTDGDIDFDELSEKLNELLWVNDSVTGNASGSYTCNTYQAEEYLAHNWDLLQETLTEFSYDNYNPIKKGAKWCDVIIRCYILGICITDALNEFDFTNYIKKFA